MVLDSLRYWATEMRVDGFRFDLCAALGREHGDYIVQDSAFFDAIRQDPVLTRLKLIAEPWDLGYPTGISSATSRLAGRSGTDNTGTRSGGSGRAITGSSPRWRRGWPDLSDVFGYRAPAALGEHQPDDRA